MLNVIVARSTVAVMSTLQFAKLVKVMVLSSTFLMVMV